MKLWCVALFFPVFLSAAPKRLSETDLYKDISQKKVKDSHLAFEPQYPLWSDGARKARWICLPPSTQIDNSNPDAWIFPAGTMVWKEFSFPREVGSSIYRRVETRYLEKHHDGSWEMVTYVWAPDESDAELAPAGGLANYYPIALGISHDIPSVQECGKCHAKGGDKILGFDPLQLSDDRDPLALHTGNPNSESVTLKYLLENHLVKRPNETWLTTPPRIHSQTESGRAAMGYMHGNCGHCHNPSGSAAMTRQYLRHSEQATSGITEPAYATTVNKKTRMFTIPGIPETYRILPGDPDVSAIHYRIDKGSMPSIGKKIVDEAAVEQIRKWIELLSPDE